MSEVLLALYGLSFSGVWVVSIYYDYYVSSKDNRYSYSAQKKYWLKTLLYSVIPFLNSYIILDIFVGGVFEELPSKRFISISDS